MTKYLIEYANVFTPGPLSCWVHKPVDSEVWDRASQFEPPLPEKLTGKGYPIYRIEYKGRMFSFSSLEEIEHCTSVFKRKVLPATHELVRDSWMKGYQHKHWFNLTRFHGVFAPNSQHRA